MEIFFNILYIQIIYQLWYILPPPSIRGMPFPFLNSIFCMAKVRKQSSACHCEMFTRVCHYPVFSGIPFLHHTLPSPWPPRFLALFLSPQSPLPCQCILLLVSKSLETSFASFCSSSSPTSHHTHARAHVYTHTQNLNLDSTYEKKCCIWKI